jgi:hypothetical protein
VVPVTDLGELLAQLILLDRHDPVAIALPTKSRALLREEWVR